MLTVIEKSLPLSRKAFSMIVENHFRMTVALLTKCNRF